MIRHNDGVRASVQRGEPRTFAQRSLVECATFGRGPSEGAGRSATGRHFRLGASVNPHQRREVEITHVNAVDDHEITRSTQMAERRP